LELFSDLPGFWREKNDNYIADVDEFCNYEILNSRPRIKPQANAILPWGQGIKTSTYLIDICRYMSFIHHVGRNTVKNKDRQDRQTTIYTMI